MRIMRTRARIAELNDRCRLGRDRRARIVVTDNCLAALGGAASPAAHACVGASLITALRMVVFASEDAGERDRGEFVLAGTRVLFRIDYYDAALEFGSEDPSDARVTTRVLTLMLPEDV